MAFSCNFDQGSPRYGTVL